MKISVVIPTVRRVEMLRSALKSVEAQSNLSVIAEIIVSENSLDTQSQSIPGEFPNLPIRYFQQAPPLSVENHFVKLIEMAASPWVAMIGDDDMWGRYHLEEACRSLAQVSEAIAYVAQCVMVENESRQARNGYTPLLSAYGGPLSSELRPYWIWNAREMLFESLFRTPLNIWGLVARKTCLLESMEFMRGGKLGLDSDRYMFWRLSLLGKILVGRETSLYYRVHLNSGCQLLAREDPGFHDDQARQFTEMMLDEAENQGIPWDQDWMKFWDGLNKRERDDIWFTSALAGAQFALVSRLKKKRAEFGYPTQKARALLMLVSCMPPILLPLLNRVWRLGRSVCSKS